MTNPEQLGGAAGGTQPYAYSAEPRTALYPPVGPPMSLPAPMRPAPVGFAVAALVVGIVAFFVGWVPVIGILLGGTAIVLGIVGLRNRQQVAMCVIGIVLGSLAALTSLLITIAISIGASSDVPPGPPSDASQVERVDPPAPAPEAEPAPEVPAPVAPVEPQQPVEAPVVQPPAVKQPTTVTVPNVVGLSATDAAASLQGAGLGYRYVGEGSARVISMSPTGSVARGTEVVLTLEQASTLSVAQQNAVRSAESYLRSMSFSRSGLISQLEYERFSTADATFAVDHLAPDWNEQAAKDARSYLDSMSFSRQGLIDQLLYEGFTPAQAEYGVAAVGY